MSVNSTGIPLFAGIEDLDDMFIATMEEMDKEISDELVIAHPLWEYVNRRNLIEYVEEIGTHVTVRLRTKRNPTVQWHTGYDDAISTPATVLDEAKFAYGHLTARQMYNREELIKNSGRGQLIDLVESKADQAFSDVNEEFADTIIGTQDGDGRKPTGLGRIMDETATVGNISPTAMTSWKPNRIYKTGATPFALATEFRDGMRKMLRTQYVSGGGSRLGAKMDGTSQRGRKPTVQLCGEDVYNEHQKWAEAALQLTIADIKNDSGWGDFEMFDFNGRTIVYEPALAAKETWLLNFDRGVKVRIHRGTNFHWTTWGYLDNKVQVKYRDNLTYVCVYSKSRRANSKMIYS